MSQSLSQVLLHVVFSTKERRPFLHREIEDELYAYLGGTLRNLGSPALVIGGADDHVHILCRLSRTMAVSDLLEEVKKNSSKWIKTKGPGYRDFAWQGGYGVFSVSLSNVEAVKAYISGQREHHHRHTFQEEFLHILHRAGVAYDDRYIWA
ncbi:MAG: IS200/IS605 family transposase [Planctomycetota bacterium]